MTTTVEFGTPALRVAWITPQSEVAICQYEVQYRRNSTTSWGSQVTISGSPPATSTILTGLDAGTEYNVRVRAVSAVGRGMWSVEQAERTFDSKFWHIIFYYYSNNCLVQCLSTCTFCRALAVVILINCCYTH